MRKTTITAAALAMSASLAGLAYAAAPDGRSTEDSSVVSTFSPANATDSATATATSTAADSSTASSTASSPTSASSASPTGTVAEDRRGRGADDPVSHDVGDDHGRGGHGADDGVTPSAMPTVPAEQRHGADDGPGHDVGDDHGNSGHGSDD